MSHEENFLSLDANVDTTTAVESLDTDNVEDAPIVAVHKPKKSKWASSRGVTKRGSLVDDDTFSPPSSLLSIDNDGSDNVVESSDMQQELQNSATNVLSVMVGESVPLDELFDHDDISIQSVHDNDLRPQPQRQILRNVCLMVWSSSSVLSRPNGANFTWETGWLELTLRNELG